MNRRDLLFQAAGAAIAAALPSPPLLSGQRPTGMFAEFLKNNPNGGTFFIPAGVYMFVGGDFVKISDEPQR